MTNQMEASHPRDTRPSWWRSRKGFAVFWIGSLLACWLILRGVLLAAFHPGSLSPATLLSVFASGLHRDLLVSLSFTIPLIWLLALTLQKPPARWKAALFWGVCGLFWFLQIFLLFVEFFFFEEFRSRFNTVAVDYLIYPHEVFVNIWESYHTGLVIAVCGALAVGWVWGARRWCGGFWNVPCTGKTRLVGLFGAIAVCALLAPSLSLKGARVGEDRTLNEIANNGTVSFLTAAWTGHLDYAAFYKTMPLDQAYAKARDLLAEPGAEFVEPGNSIRRKIKGDPLRPRLNVVLCLEESLGSEFWGCLGRTNSLTPEMDRVAAKEGLLFTNLYASGNRTVRGMEGVLSSFPPLPGDSIVKRDRSDNVETLARVLKRDGYSTAFIYGGRGVFDGMRSYAIRNGYDRFIEQKDFKKPTFSTIWGVCDEDLFARGIEECRELSDAGKPFFMTLLTVSNHKPYTYPKGRIAERPEDHKRENAVKYSDYALGKLFRDAKQESFWTNTIFVVVADHGARVYGRQTIPIHSYEIPLVIAGPATVPAAARVGHLGCSLDVGPTILGLIGRPYESLFFGRNLLLGESRALLNHNRDIGMLSDGRLAVLNLKQGGEFYGGNLKGMKTIESPSEADIELQRDTIALFQVADDLYINRKYRLDN